MSIFAAAQLVAVVIGTGIVLVLMPEAIMAGLVWWVEKSPVYRELFAHARRNKRFTGRYPDRLTLVCWRRWLLENRFWFGI